MTQNAKRGRKPKHIDAEDMEMVKYRFLSDMTFKEIGTQFDITRQAVQQRIKRVVEKMADAL